MKVRSTPWFVISMIVAAVFLYFIADRSIFLARAEETVGEVTNLTSVNSRCGSRRSRHACTKFSAEVRFFGAGDSQVLNVSAGSSRGHYRPLSAARHYRGERVNVVYNPRNPREAYRDTFWDVWSAPIVTLFVQIASLFASTRERKDA
jgi:hypothetical protein